VLAISHKGQPAVAVRSEDGTNPEAGIWRLAPTRRNVVGFVGWSAVMTSIGIGTLAWVRLMYPRVLFEPPTAFKLGKPTEYAPASVSDKWIRAYRFWLIRYPARFIALSATCTHLGCTPRFLANEDKFKCPCHGSGFRGYGSGWKVVGTNFEGPAPRPLERFKLTMSDGGELMVEKAVTYRIDKEETEKIGAFLPYA
jgi:cytochrome b6-f complex iron-sulfur subunit